MNKNPHEQSANRRIPGYSGYIPSIKSENIHGSTYGKTTKQSEKGVFTKGMQYPPSLRFQSTNQANFVDQMQFHDPLDDIVAARDDNDVPVGESTKFFGDVPEDEDTLAKNAQVFYGDGSLLRDSMMKEDNDIDRFSTWKVRTRPESLAAASSKFYNHPNDKAPVDPAAWESLPLSYAEARQMASQEQ